MFTQCDNVSTRHNTTTSQGEEASHQEAVERFHVVHEGEETRSYKGMHTEGERRH